MSSKEKIVNYINQVTNEEPYRIIDIFHNTRPNNGKLTYCGFKILRKMYDFYEIEVEFDGSILAYRTLLRYINGLYYEYGTKAKNHIRLETTDKKFVNRMKLMNFKFDLLQEKVRKNT